MKQTTLLAAALIISVSIAKAQKQFNKIIQKQTNNLIQHGNQSGTKTFTGGYALAEGNGNDAYISVFDSSFNQLWSRNINIQSGHRSEGLAVAQSTLDSSFCLLGVTYDPSRPEYDFLLSRISKNGKILSNTSFLWAVSGGGNCRALALPKGKFLLGLDGNSAGIVGLLLVNNLGQFTAVKNISLNGKILLFSDVIITADHGLMVTGDVMQAFGNEPRDLFCLKLNSRLQIEWAKTYATGNLEEVNGIIQTRDGGYFMYGYQQQVDHSSNSRFVKLSATGDIQWNKLVHLSSNSIPFSATQTYDGGYALTGVELYKLNRQGNIQWISTQSFTNNTYPVVETKDKGLVTFSQFDATQFNIIKTDSAGNNCNPSYTRTYTMLSDALTVQPATFTITDGTAQQINTGTVFTDAGTSNFTVCSMNTLTGSQSIESSVKSTVTTGIKLYPNPAREKIFVTSEAGQLFIADATGKVVVRMQLQAQASYPLNIATLSPGMYYVTLVTKSARHISSFIKQ